MRRIAQFYKVSAGQFIGAVKEEFPQYTQAELENMYEQIMLPRRATRGSAG